MEGWGLDLEERRGGGWECWEGVLGVGNGWSGGGINEGLENRRVERVELEAGKSEAGASM